MATQYSSDFKLRVVKLVSEKDFSIYSVAKQLEISSRSIRRWLKRFQETGSVDRHAREVSAYKVHQKHVDFALQYIKEHNTISLKDLNNILISTFDDYAITPQWLGKVLRANNETRKRVRKFHDPKTRFGKPIDRKRMKQDFYARVKQWPLDHIICLDETAVQLFMHKNYARCRIGKRCILQTHDNRIFKSYTLLVAISSSRVVGWILFEDGGTDTEKLVHFIQKHINSHYRNHLVIMDNVGAHRHPSVRQAIENGGNELLYSVPFFSRSNAIEHLFSQLKHYLRDAVPKSIEELRDAIRMTLQTKIKPKNLQGYFNLAYGQPPPVGETRHNRRLRVPPRYKT